MGQTQLIRKQAKKLAVGGALLSLVGIGHYEFIGGQTTYAIGRVEKTELGTQVTGLKFKDKQEFRDAMVGLPEDVRRIDFKCPDKSNAFTLYVTPLGLVGFPNETVVCQDGSTLVAYEE